MRIGLLARQTSAGAVLPSLELRERPLVPSVRAMIRYDSDESSAQARARLAVLLGP
jgi:hypothetical protein